MKFKLSSAQTRVVEDAIISTFKLELRKEITTDLVS